MNRSESEYVNDHQLGVDNYHEYIVEQLNRYMYHQNTFNNNMSEQGIDTIRPPERSGYNTPARQSTSISNKQPPLVNTDVPPRLQTSPPPPPLVNTTTTVPPRLDTSRPPLTSGGQISRPSFAVDLVIGFKEISLDLRKCVKDVVNQNLYVVNKLSQAVLFLMFFVVAALYVNHESDTSSPLLTKPFIHPPNATHMLLPDGRHLAYQEQGVPSEKARFSIIAPHTFLSSRLGGIPGLRISLMQEFGVRLITYDLPGFGKSDPHPNRNLKSSAHDMLQLSYNMGVTDKFWVVGYSSGSLHAWAALKYIPDRLAGAFMVSPMINPYEPGMTKEERRLTWNKWTVERKFMYFLARRFPRFLPYFYRKTFLSANVGQRDKWLSLSLGKRDRAFIEGEMFQEFWKRDVEESVRQGNAKPFMEEAVMQVSSWGFSLEDLIVEKKDTSKGILLWLKSKYSQAEEEMTGFCGPIHIWQGMDDKVVPPSMVEFVERVLPGAMVHKLFYHGHFTFFYFCHECHRQIFSTVFGDPKGPLITEVDHTPTLEDNKEIKEVIEKDGVI